MTDSITVRVVRNQFWHDGEARTPDSDPFEVEESVAADHPRTLERVDDGGDVDGGSDEADGTSADPGEHTIDELEAKLEDVDDPEVLRELVNLERSQKNRDGALDAIEARLDELEGSEE
ncbi:hypothetical protein [Natrinema soli]|uniref:Uncharacterized protein n=1 Tax=Natrinema soli TaxID=1930624 RepID=A0ABD5SM85_9EURY|nr:hypothetical protein [Natrinema soli]